ncbi:MAG TPA: glucose-6-phosphate isomerase [Verrucomicrobiae bacterium]|nr:glucose-6-phosphate isomerase [Verrucomicrobiae bacterium]
MLNLRYDFNNLMAERVGEHGVTDAELKALGPKLFAAADAVEKAALGFRKLPYDTKLADEITALAGKIRERCDDFVVVGIGGSALGNRALHSALNHPEYNLLNRPPRRGPRMFVADNIDPDRIAALLDVIDIEKAVFNVITKSGGTAETLSEFLVFRDALIKRLGPNRHIEHIVITTDPHRGEFCQIAKHFGYDSLPVPPDVGGRFSVISAVGLLGAAVTGIDVHKLLRGAAEMDALCRKSKRLWENPALTGAALHYLMDKAKGKNIQVMMPYSHALRDVSNWFRQLWAESLGKQSDRAGKRVLTGQTPERALGVTDQHSVMQLYVEGPFDKVVTFLTVDEFHATVAIPSAFPDFDAVKYLGGHTLNELMSAEQQATELALTQSGKPNCAIRLPRVDEETVGALLYMLEMQTAYAGELYNINAFDQPGVELGKNYTYGLMGRKGYESKRREVEQVGKPNRKWVVTA